MAIYALGVLVPRIDPDAYVHPDAVIIGDVTVGPESSIWPGAVLRGDGGGHIVIGARTSIQDKARSCTAPPSFLRSRRRRVRHRPYRPP